MYRSARPMLSMQIANKSATAGESIYVGVGEHAGDYCRRHHGRH